MIDFSAYLASPEDWSLFLLCAMLIGMSKTGVNGIGTLSIPIMAFLFEARQSTGIILPMLCIADITAVIYYRRTCELSYILKLIPWAIIGFGIAIYVDRIIPANTFRQLMGWCIIASVLVLLWSKRLKEERLQRFLEASWFSPICGLIGGFTTMIGNAAGPVMSVYLLSMNLPKYLFIGTAAWFFLIVNILKLPLQIFVWHNINQQTLQLNLMAIPAILLGSWMGTRILRHLPERIFRRAILLLTVLSAILMVR